MYLYDYWILQIQFFLKPIYKNFKLTKNVTNKWVYKDKKKVIFMPPNTKIRVLYLRLSISFFVIQTALHTYKSAFLKPSRALLLCLLHLTNKVKDMVIPPQKVKWHQRMGICARVGSSRPVPVPRPAFTPFILCCLHPECQ